VRKALRELTAPLIGSTITPVVVFLPLISVAGVTGLFFRALAVTMAAALLTSLALALTWTPGLSFVLLSERRARPHDHSAGRLMNGALRLHRRVLDWALARPAWLGVICVLLVIGAWAGYQALGSDLLPQMDEGGFILDYIMPAGSSLAETNRVLERVEKILRSEPEVENTSRRTGLQLGLAAVTEANTGDFTVRLKARRSRSVWEVMDDVRARIKAAEPELDIELTQILQDNINDLSNAPEPIQVKLFSNDEQLLTQLGPRVGDAIAKIPGVVDVENGIDNTISGPATQFQVDPSVASRLGFTPQEISEDATAILDGIPAAAPVIANGRPYTIRVRLSDEHRSSLDTIRNTVFNSASGRTASLGSLANVEQLPPQNEIRRENLQRLIVVTADLEGSDLGTAIARVRQAVAGLHLPSSVRVEYGGTYEEQQKSFRDLLRVLLLALALVFGVLLAEFRNFPAPIAILASSVLSISGVIAALLVTGTTFNVASFMGLIMVIGIVAKNGILLLDADEKYRAEGASAREAMMQAAQRRLRPIAMTAIAAVCGMLPLAFAIGSGSQMLQPLAIAVIGGLVVSMALSLVVTPLVYFLLTRNRQAAR
jgi:multidrug efflux pump subunit AcrB